MHLRESCGQAMRGGLMFPVLLLLLLQESPCRTSDEVCFRISGGTVDANITMVNSARIISITDDFRHESSRCTSDNSSCLVVCGQKCNKLESVNSSGSFCLKTNVTKQQLFSKFSIQESLKCAVSFCNESMIFTMIEMLVKPKSDHTHLMKLFRLRDSCPQRFSDDRELKMAFIDAERRITHNIIRLTELEPGESRSYNLTTMALKVVRFSDANLTCASRDNRTRIDAPQLLPQNKSFVPETWLPVDALLHIPQEERTVGLVSYMNHKQFQFKQETISSMVIRIELLGERRLQNLSTSVKMIFNVTSYPDMTSGSHFQCRYFSEHEWLWKTDGCETEIRTCSKLSQVTCSCDHMTPFAVLLIRDSIAEVHWRILSYITYIGCSLSAFFTVLSILIYIFSRNHRMDHSISIHTSLSGALLLLNTAFLLSEWGATVEPEWVCVLVAAVTHYSLLCCFTWTAIEALHIYLLLIKVFNTYYKHYLLKLSAAGWGIPGVIVTVSLGVKDIKQFYGVTEMTMADSNQTSSICWITDTTFFYSLNLLYFALVFIFNSGILVLVASRICKMKGALRRKVGAQARQNTSTHSARYSESCKSSLTVLGLTFLMGISWGLALLSTGYVNYPVLYLFCILNSTQGFFIFLWICLSAKKQRQREMEAKTTATPTRSSAFKSE